MESKTDKAQFLPKQLYHIKNGSLQAKTSVDTRAQKRFEFKLNEIKASDIEPAITEATACETIVNDENARAADMWNEDDIKHK